MICMKTRTAETNMPSNQPFSQINNDTKRYITHFQNSVTSIKFKDLKILNMKKKTWIFSFSIKQHQLIFSITKSLFLSNERAIAFEK